MERKKAKVDSMYKEVLIPLLAITKITNLNSKPTKYYLNLLRRRKKRRKLILKIRKEKLIQKLYLKRDLKLKRKRMKRAKIRLYMKLARRIIL